MSESNNMSPEVKADGPPFTVDRYGSLGECFIAEATWSRARIDELESMYSAVRKSLDEHSAAVFKQPQLETKSHQYPPAGLIANIELLADGMDSDVLDLCISKAVQESAAIRLLNGHSSALRKLIADARTALPTAPIETAEPQGDFSQRWLDVLRQFVPCTYGDAIVAKWIKHGDCESHEWDNRTSAENARWMLERLLPLPTECIHEWSAARRGTHECLKGCGATMPYPSLPTEAPLGVDCKEHGFTPAVTLFACPKCQEQNSVRIKPVVPPTGDSLCERVGKAFIENGYLDRLFDMTPEDNAERIIGEVLPIVAAALKEHARVSGATFIGRPPDEPTTTREKCDPCSGAGFYPEDMALCVTCNGTGRVVAVKQSPEPTSTHAMPWVQQLMLEAVHAIRDCECGHSQPNEARRRYLKSIIDRLVDASSETVHEPTEVYSK